jgi:hypothetical protein
LFLADSYLFANCPDIPEVRKLLVSFNHFAASGVSKFGGHYEPRRRRGKRGRQGGRVRYCIREVLARMRFSPCLIYDVQVSNSPSLEVLKIQALL